MKRILLISLLAVAGCRPASVIPEAGTGDPQTNGGTVSIAFLKTLHKGAPVKITGEYIISGVVVSSDMYGNFYKTLVVDDGTGGIELKPDMEETFKTFPIHSRVTVRCNGLWLGSYGGTLQLGTEPYGIYQTQYIPSAMIAEHVRSDTEFHGEVLPCRLSFPEIVPAHISTFAELDGVRFAEEEIGLSWADAEAETDTDRHLVDVSGDTLIVRTSRRATFAGRMLPRGSGRIEGVIGYFNGKYRLVVCSDQSAEMEAERF